MGNDISRTAQALSAQGEVVDSLMLGMNLEGIIAAMFFSLLGMCYLRYGKKTDHTLIMICGLILLGFPYLVSNTLYILLIGTMVSVLPLFFRKLKKMGL